MKGATTSAGAADRLFRQVEDEADRLPDYAELYRRWEVQPWSPLALDFRRDAEQWRTATPELRRQWLGIGRFHGFHLGEAHLMRALAAFLEALPRPDQKRFVATQIADEARHDAFFDRFLEEALGLPPEETSAEAVLPRLSPGMRHLFLELLPARARRLAAEPHDRAALVEGVALVHLLIEGTLALSNMRVVLHDFRRLGLFPGFQAGFLHVVRDEARHVLFGVRVLRDLAREEVLRERLVAFLVQALPWARQVLVPAPQRCAALLAEGVDPLARHTFALGALRRWLRAIGLSPLLLETVALKAA